MDESPEGRTEHLPRPRFGRGADVEKQQALLEGKLSRCVTENTISLLFAQALGQQKEWVCAGGLHSVCGLRVPVAAASQTLHLKATTTRAQVASPADSAGEQDAEARAEQSRLDTNI